MINRVSSLVANTLYDYGKNHMKRMFKVKAHFTAEEWDLIDANSQYISYIS